MFFCLNIGGVSLFDVGEESSVAKNITAVFGTSLTNGYLGLTPHIAVEEKYSSHALFSDNGNVNIGYSPV